MEADEMLRSIPVLVVSTDGSEHRVQQMMSLGAKGYVKKPFSPELLRGNWIDIVLTDINMPVMNGEEFVRCMEADEMLRSIPVLVVSTDGSEHRVQQMMSLGAKGYVKKPFSPELLRKNMEQLLGVSSD